jgi:hypothetical protein
MCSPFGDRFPSLFDSYFFHFWKLGNFSDFQLSPPTFPSVGLFRRPILGKCSCYPFGLFSKRICRKSYFHFVLPLRRFPGFSLILVFDRLSWASFLRILGYLLPTIFPIMIISSSEAFFRLLLFLMSDKLLVLFPCHQVTWASLAQSGQWLVPIYVVLYIKLYFSYRFWYLYSRDFFCCCFFRF